MKEQNQQLDYIDLVNSARAGSVKALELIIHSIVNEPDPNTGVPILFIYARTKSFRLKTWSEDDIISRMKEIIWNAVMGTGDPSRIWKADKGCSLPVACWQWLKNDMSDKCAWEHRRKRSVEFYSIDDFHEYSRLPDEIVTKEKSEQILLKIDIQRKIEKNWSKLSTVQKLIIEKFLLGYNLSEIMEDINRRGSFGRYYPERVRLEFRNMRRKLFKSKKKC